MFTTRNGVNTPYSVENLVDRVAIYQILFLDMGNAIIPCNSFSASDSGDTQTPRYLDWATSVYHVSLKNRSLSEENHITIAPWSSFNATMPAIYYTIWIGLYISSWSATGNGTFSSGMYVYLGDGRRTSSGAVVNDLCKSIASTSSRGSQPLELVYGANTWRLFETPLIVSSLPSRYRQLDVTLAAYYGTATITAEIDVQIAIANIVLSN